MSEPWTKERCDAILAIRQPLGLVGILNRQEMRRERLARFRKIRRRRYAMNFLVGLAIMLVIWFFAQVARMVNRDE